MSSDFAISVRGLSKSYRLGQSTAVGGSIREAIAGAVASRLRGTASRSGRDWVWALEDISFDVPHGEVLGLVGRNGAGKTTLLKILSGITDPTAGEARIRGQVGALLEVGTGFHPDLTGRENVYMNGAILGMGRREIDRKFDQIVDFAGIARFIDTPVKRYSSGMYLRLAFSVAAHLEPDILLVDEVLAVGDAEFQARCLGKMGDVARAGRTVLFVSHNLAAVSSLCTRAILLLDGKMALDGSPDAVIREYLSRVHEKAQTDVRARSDRQGSGDLRFTRVQVWGPEGHVRSGDEVWVDLEYESTRQCAAVMVSIAVNGQVGEPLLHCSSKVSGDDFGALPVRGGFRCVLPRLPLAAGRYSLNIFAEANGAIADWLIDAATFDVAEGDFFGTGQLPPSTHGQFYVEHSWSVVQHALEELPVSQV